MGRLGRVFTTVCCVLVGLVATAQVVRVHEEERVQRFDLRDLEDGTTALPGQGSKVPGLDLLHRGARHAFGDSVGRGSLDLADSTWSNLSNALDTVVRGQGIHWFRSWVQPAASLKGVPLTISVVTEHSFRLYLNGRLLANTDRPHLSPGSATGNAFDSLRSVSIPVLFRCDQEPELIALRCDGDPGVSLRNTDLSITLHPADLHFRMQRNMMHLGVFVGINCTILLLSLVIWWLERRSLSWLLLALLSFVSALETICEVGSEMGLLGLSARTVRALHVVDLLLLPWPMYLLIMVLGSMGLGLTGRRRLWYTMGALVVTLECAAFLVAEANGLVTSEEGISLLGDSPWLIIPGLFLLTLFGSIVAWFSVDVIRLGIRLLRTKGASRWVGGGAVASSLFALFLNIISSVSGLAAANWLSLAADYCSYAAVPLSVAVYLAIRSAHHNRLVERQRDDLDREVQERTSELRREKERSDELLLNILPAEVAEELKTQGAAAARHFDEASVLFTDFKGFTSMAAQVDAAELLQELNICFHAFDDIIDAHGVEKIKTIGDAYMCAGGLPDPRSAGPLAVVLAGLEMQEYIQRRKTERMQQGKPAFEMRVGIHTGPVVAGIVGVKKFQYDIWGDTVNTASRMESSGEVGKVNISAATYALVKDHPELTFTPRGHVQAKGKGEMEMYFVSRTPAP